MILKPPLGAQLRVGHPLANGLKGFWALNEGAGTLAYDHAGGHNGVAGANADWEVSPYGPAALFDGTIGSVFKPDNIADMEPDGDFSICCVCRQDASAASLPGPFCMGHDAGRNRGTMFLETGGNWRFYIWDSGWKYVAGSSATIGEWFFLVGVRRGSDLYFWINGTRYGPTTVGAAASWGTVYGGIGTYGSDEFEGAVAQAAMWHRALGDGEVAALTADPFAPIRQPDPIELWTGATSVGGGGPAGGFFARRYYDQFLSGGPR